MVWWIVIFILLCIALYLVILASAQAEQLRKEQDKARKEELGCSEETKIKK